MNKVRGDIIHSDTGVKTFDSSEDPPNAEKPEESTKALSNVVGGTGGETNIRETSHPLV